MVACPAAQLVVCRIWDTAQGIGLHAAGSPHKYFTGPLLFSEWLKCG